MNQWLRSFAYRTGFSWWIFAVSAAAAILIGDKTPFSNRKGRDKTNDLPIFDGNRQIDKERPSFFPAHNMLNINTLKKSRSRRRGPQTCTDMV